MDVGGRRMWFILNLRVYVSVSFLLRALLCKHSLLWKVNMDLDSFISKVKKIYHLSLASAEVKRL